MGLFGLNLFGGNKAEAPKKEKTKKRAPEARRTNIIKASNRAEINDEEVEIDMSSAIEDEDDGIVIQGLEKPKNKAEQNETANYNSPEKMASSYELLNQTLSNKAESMRKEAIAGYNKNENLADAMMVAAKELDDTAYLAEKITDLYRQMAQFKDQPEIQNWIEVELNKKVAEFEVAADNLDAYLNAVELEKEIDNEKNLKNEKILDKQRARLKDEMAILNLQMEEAEEAFIKLQTKIINMSGGFLSLFRKGKTARLEELAEFKLIEMKKLEKNLNSIIDSINELLPEDATPIESPAMKKHKEDKAMRKRY